MTAQVYIVENNVTNTLNVPAAAVKRDPKLGTYVQVVQADGTTKQQPVKVGVTNRVNTQIISGITEGQKVVIGESTNSGSGGNSSMGSARARASMM
jgi:macrolide-specific efflux system membrane fusion protein